MDKITHCNEYWALRLLNMPRIGNAKVRRILDACKAKGLSLSDFVARIKQGTEKTTLVEASRLIELEGENPFVDEQWVALQETSIKPLLFGHEDYPTDRMRPLNNHAPVLIFARGNLTLLEKPSLGFCGSRKASEKGLRTAWDCADQMARKGVNIVSGYASGVDMTTHKAALEAGGSTTVVLAEGILNFRIKKAIGDLFDESRILIISEFLPRLPWSVRNAMQRNSTICALSDAMVLIEAQERGGSVSAGRACLEMQRPLFAPVYEGMPESATGNMILLGNGARELKKSRKTDRANLTRIEEILFGVENGKQSYPIDSDSDGEQLALFEKPAGYKNSDDNPEVD